jgi:FkbM family methyltransferase
MGEIISLRKPANYKTINQGYGEFLWPERDTQCMAAVFGEIPKLVDVIGMVPTKGIAVQAGGNCGVFASILSKHFDAVYTFEPDLVNYSCLSANVPEFNVYKFPAAVGNCNTCIAMANGPSEDETNCGAFRVGGAGSTPTLMIDQLGLPRCDLIYLDVEGEELAALDGASNTIGRFHPVIVCEEKGLGGLKDGQIAEFLAQFGYLPDKKLQNDQIYR